MNIEDNSRKVISIDFDGTIVEDKYPLIGWLRKDARDVINKLYDEGYIIIINSCRQEVLQEEAEVFLTNAKIEYHKFNENDQDRIDRYNNDSRKIGADFYIDDKQIGGIPSWKDIYSIIKSK